jgi:hypothetical protein
MSRRSESRERSSVINGTDVDENEQKELERFRTNVDAALSVYNEAHQDDKLEMTRCIIKKGAMRLKFSYKRVSSIEDLDARLWKEFCFPGGPDFSFDFSIKADCLEAFTPLRNVTVTKKKNISSMLATPLMYLLFAALILWYGSALWTDHQYQTK